jgi:signal transduction histidine kinase
MKRTRRGSSQYAYIFVSINLMLMLVFFASVTMSLRDVDESQDHFATIVRDWYSLQLSFQTDPGSRSVALALSDFENHLSASLGSDLFAISGRLSRPLGEAAQDVLTTWQAFRAAYESQSRAAGRLPEFEANRFDESLARLEFEIHDVGALQQRSLEIVLYFLGATILATIGVFLGVEMENQRDRRAADQVQTLARVTISAQEAERSRISQALHDSLAQELSVAMLEVGELASTDSPVVREQLRQRLRNAVEWTRDLAHELHPAEIEQVGLAGAVNSYCRELAAREGVNLDWDVSRDVDDVDHEISINVYRIAQEALTNAIRHAHAELIVLRLEVVDDNIELTVSDDGTGFRSDDTGIPVGNTGLGLVSMRERASMMDADLRIVSDPGAGALVRLTIPFRCGQTVEKGGGS